MSKEKHTCEGVIGETNSNVIISKMIGGYADRLCGNTAKYFENEKWYCGRHSPSKIREREDKRFEEWEKKIKKT